MMGDTIAVQDAPGLPTFEHTTIDVGNETASQFELYPTTRSIYWSGRGGNMPCERDSRWVTRASNVADGAGIVRNSSEKAILERAMRIGLYIATTTDAQPKVRDATLEYERVIQPLENINPDLHFAMQTSDLHWFFVRNVLMRTIRDTEDE